MKIHQQFTLVAALATSVLALHAKLPAGPKGGRLLEAEGQKAEFFVNADRKVEVAFYDAALKPIDPGSHVVAVTAEAPSGRAKLDLDKSPAGFVSKEALPSGEPYRVVVQIRVSADAKPQNFRVDLNLAECGECKLKEYACICEGH